MPDDWAHPQNAAGARQPLEEHAFAVAETASAFAAPFGASELARYLGLWHDAGKYGAAFQRYLLAAEANPLTAGPSPDHKAAGMLVARQYGLDLLLPALQGHHGGLPDPRQVRAWLPPREDAARDALATARRSLPELWPPLPPELPAYAAGGGPLVQEFLVRMLFSALVDADLLAAEEHFFPEIRVLNAPPVDTAALLRRFEESTGAWAGAEDPPPAGAAAEVYAACVEASAFPPGCFRLNAPADAGGRLAALAFALHHAAAHGRRRIVAAVPHGSLTGPLAALCRALFDRPGDTAPAVLEHDSAAGELRREDEEYSPYGERRRSAAENWDAPVVVTTAAQIFEALLGSGAGPCRRLHRLAGSVLLLEEAQLLPHRLLDAIAGGIGELCAHYGASVVLHSSVPGAEAAPLFARVPALPILREPQRLFAAGGRPRCEWRLDRPLDWREAADLLGDEPQALCIVDGIQDALDLFDALGDPEALHLSALLCGRHREDVLREAGRRLGGGGPCRLVTTGAAAAGLSGVDLPFPLVLRAEAPLDRVALSAGLAGPQPRGRVVVFRPQDGRASDRDAERALAAANELLAAGPVDVHDAETLRRYFTQMGRGLDGDPAGVQKLRRAFDYPAAAQAARFTPDTVSVVVPYGDAEERRRVEQFWQALENRAGSLRRTVRLLQPYTVNLLWEPARRYLGPEQIQLSPLPRLGLWRGAYDGVRGIVTGLPADRIAV